MRKERINHISLKYLYGDVELHSQGEFMKIEQYIMAYGVEHDRLRALLPEGFTSLRPVLRINAEIQNGETGYVEFNTAVEKDGFKGWLNIGHWTDVSFSKDEGATRFQTDFLDISFMSVGIEGSCPAEKDNDGCIFLDGDGVVRTPDIITAHKEFCDCEFKWTFTNTDAHGKSIGETLPAIPTEMVTHYPKQAFTVENAAHIPCEQVLGTYTVIFERETQ